MRLTRLVPAPLRRRLRAVLPAKPRTPPAPLHVIATRHGIGVFDEQWFAYRQLMLEHLPLASLDAQTCRDFTWVITVDRDMPPVARRRLDELAAPRPYIRITETELKRDFVPDLVQWVREEARARGKRWVLTTRLDDDDAVDRGLVARLHQESAAYLAEGPKAAAVLSPTLGCNWVPSKAAGHRAYHHSPSIGLSLLEKASGATTVYRGNHRTLAQGLAQWGVNVRHLDGQTMWWLYAHTGLSHMQSEGSDRMDKVAGHRNGFALDAEALARFGVTPEGARLLRETPEPERRESLHQLNNRGHELEGEIVALRERIGEADAGEEVRERIAALHAERRRMHERLVR
ncbi:glycosyltransferase [Glycomyces harbinensis]|uniref:Putative rhamnosyl transferase n=1 Tax=Glycomyces harbinensis TaxID=58114 RepID=A0A1G6V5D3_9ACTN|nr:glycosyltransferase [Glycomyces harbinensis]SDD48792.1 Putative rhamnosyl transferase [Glycomyces harbinensis]